jgi:uncharacterized protein (DUF362 family)/Pyruvate/2-oxoacid:ferredoxin oxidoreductase delta subunit
MDTSKVVLIRCSSYDEQEVFAAVRQGVELLGGVKQFAAPGEKLLLKPNVLTGAPYPKGVCTHPAVVKAVGRLFRAVTADLWYGDSPGVGKAGAGLESCGISPAAREIGLQLAEFDRGRAVEWKDSPHHRSFTIAEGVLATQGIVNLARFKTHYFTRMTGAVKNLYGCISGFQKKALHVVYPTPSEFSRMLVALNLLLRPRPRLHIMDGIVAMEGNGPSAGRPRPLGVLLFSTDPVALDAVMCRLVELNPLYMGSARPGRAWGLGTYLEEEIQLLGDPWTVAVDGDFQVPRGPVLNLSGGGAMTYVNHLIGRRPVIDNSKCTRCGQCVQACPVRPKAVDWHDGNRKKSPSYRYLRCIRCYCCQEICPEGAISVKRTILKV